MKQDLTIQDVGVSYGTVLISYVQDLDFMTMGALLLLVFRLIYDGNRAVQVMHSWFNKDKKNDKEPD